MENPYIPELAVIKETKDETSDVKTFKISFRDKKSLDYLPGQFIELTVFGYGEFPTSISSSPIPRKDFFETSIKRMGDATNALHRLDRGSIIGARGPFGNGFPVDELKGNNILFVAGGIGSAPLRSLIYYTLANREDFGSLKLLYGARTPDDIVFKKEVMPEGKIGQGLDVFLTVDKANEKWRGHVGVVTTLSKETEITPENTFAVICGPTVMIKFAVAELLKMGFQKDQLIVSLERMMKCGMGMCGHCNIGAKYVCKDGPVFTCKETGKFLELPF
jgi:NAD(P)H-flavin reductase